MLINHKQKKGKRSKKLLSPEQREKQQLIAFLNSEKAVNAWIEANKSHLGPETMEEFRQLIENFRPLSAETIEELRQLIDEKVRHHKSEIEERQKAQEEEPRRKRFTRAAWRLSLPNLLGASG